MLSKHLLTSCLPVALACLAALPGLSAHAAEPVTLSVATTQPGITIPADALGVSYETSRMLPDENGVHYFRPDNLPLVNVFKTLGIKNLRTGGNSVDAHKFPVPDEKDVISFFEFAKVAGVKVIYSFRLEDGDPEAAAKTARLIHDRYADLLQTFAIGNEPYYYKDDGVYSQKWKAIRDAILAVYPDAKFSGADHDPELGAKLAADFGEPPGQVVQVTTHSYPFGCAYKFYKEGDITKLDSNKIARDASNKVAMTDTGKVLLPFDAAASREKMVAPDAGYGTYEKIRKNLADIVAEKPLTFRLTETNSFWFSGLQGASDSGASALWGADYLHWWTSHGAAGLNFHTGDRTGGTVTMICRYAAFVTAPHGYEVRPLGYGMKLFALGGVGKVLPVSLSTPPPGRPMVAYANLGDDKTVSVTFINKEHDAGAEPVKVRIKLDQPLAVGAKREAILLTLKNGDIAGGSSDVTLGGAPIEEDGSWKGKWTALPESEGSGDTIDLLVPPASAAVIRSSVR